MPHLSRIFNRARVAPLGCALALLLAAGCQAEVASHRSALTGEECTPDGSYEPRPGNSGHGRDADHPGRGGQNSPTGIPGDNMDDEHSGKVDCLGDGNSGQGDDKKHNCEFPPGCDENGCCDDDMVPPPADEPPADEPPADEPPADEPICETNTCSLDSECEEGASCFEGCCVADIL